MWIPPKLLSSECRRTWFCFQHEIKLINHLCVLQVSSFNKAVEGLVEDLEEGLLGLFNFESVIQELKVYMKLIETGLCLLLTDVENVALSLSIRISKKGTGNVDVQKPESVRTRSGGERGKRMRN